MIKVELDVSLWLNNKGQVELFVGDDPTAVEMHTLIDMIRNQVEAHKVGLHLDHADVKKMVRLRNCLTKCVSYLNKEIAEAK